ncbi:MAG: 23S rRNA (pseudouridine(1915)-N(3))-methyltransferase RlmH [Bacteroidales bacterium]|nr:23S rRNA (pseudouridine(1915)-N(3))-methyltransferase RlmH [Bacteroidales bacterium]MCF8327750.1 23S rRNA (pseudouridine(1915)-N(3))-methyltransferase RlmH [Bacteroidales bacterium]
MEILFLLIGQTSEDYLKQGMEIYQSRIRHYIKFDVKEVRLNKKELKKDPEEQKKAEGSALLKQIKTTDFVILLDEHGQEYTSKKFAAFLQKKMNAGKKRIVFVVGGAYGFDKQITERANAEIALSRMTFPHQLIRLLFLEQLYRAFTILKGEPYHNE